VGPNSYHVGIETGLQSSLLSQICALSTGFFINVLCLCGCEVVPERARWVSRIIAAGLRRISVTSELPMQIRGYPGNCSRS